MQGVRAEEKRGGVMKTRWARVDTDWICKDCGNPDAKHYANELCRKCYMRRFRKEHGIPQRQPRERACAECGTVTKIKGRDLCPACYSRLFRREHLEHVREYDYKKCEEERFGGRRGRLIDRAGGGCELCGMTDAQSIKKYGQRLEIHHRDGRGAASKNPNHSDDNLMVLCKSCHAGIHGKSRGGLNNG